VLNGKEEVMSDTSRQGDWTKPAAMAIPKGGVFKDKVQQGRYGPIFPKSPACYGFTIIAKIIPGREDVFYEYAKNIEKAVADQPDCLAVLKLHYLRWVLFPIKGETYFMYQGIFDTDFDKYTEDAVALFSKYGINTVFENLEGFPADWKTNAPAFVKFVREHQCPSFLEYGEYPYVSSDEIKKALKVKANLSNMLDQMQ
jgi:hypothetical protein